MKSDNILLYDLKVVGEALKDFLDFPNTTTKKCLISENDRMKKRWGMWSMFISEWIDCIRF